MLNSLLETRPVNGAENLKIAFALLKVHYLCYKVHQIKLPIVDCNWQNSFIFFCISARPSDFPNLNNFLNFLFSINLKQIDVYWKFWYLLPSSATFSDQIFEFTTGIRKQREYAIT